MPNVDANGIPTFLGSDPLDYNGLLNMLSGAVSAALDEQVRIIKVANVNERNNLATNQPPTTSNPLIVWRQDSGIMELNSGDGWKEWPPPSNWDSITGKPGNNQVEIGGQMYRKSGRFSVNMTLNIKIGQLFRGNTTWTAPYKPPAGWAWSITAWPPAGGRRAWLGYMSGTNTQTVSIGVITPVSTGNTKITMHFHWQLLPANSTTD